MKIQRLLVVMPPLDAILPSHRAQDLAAEGHIAGPRRIAGLVNPSGL